MVQELQPDDLRQIGPYRLLGRLGSGGMGRVYLGLSPGGRPVAVKVIHTHLAAEPGFRARFRREAAAARKVLPLVECCLVKEPAGRPTAADILAKMSPVHPDLGWLAGPVIRAYSEEPVPRSPAVSGGVVYVGTDNNAVYAMSAAIGT